VSCDSFFLQLLLSVGLLLLAKGWCAALLLQAEAARLAAAARLQRGPGHCCCSAAPPSIHISFTVNTAPWYAWSGVGAPKMPLLLLRTSVSNLLQQYPQGPRKVPYLARLKLSTRHTTTCLTMSINSVSKRSSSVAQEDLKMKPPLTGLFNSCTPPRGDESMVDVCAGAIADARAGLNGINADELSRACKMCDAHGRDVKLFQETQPGAVASKLTPSLVAALALYTAELHVGESPYGVCNGALRAADRGKCKPFVPFIWHVIHAMAKCDRYEGTQVFRGVKADLSAQYPKDREVTWFQFSSCTCDIQVEQSEQFCGSSGTRTLFSIELTTGRARIITKFSLVPSEAEVLLPPNSRFKVVSQFDAGNGLIIIQLKELPPNDPIIHFDAVPSVTSALFSSFSLSVPALSPSAVGGAGGHLASAALDPELEVLADSLVALKVGVQKACASFAAALGHEGIMSMEDLCFLSDAQARELLARAGMKEVQQMKVMQAIPRASAPAPTPTPTPAPAPAGFGSAPASGGFGAGDGFGAPAHGGGFGSTVVHGGGFGSSDGFGSAPASGGFGAGDGFGAPAHGGGLSKMSVKLADLWQAAYLTAKQNGDVDKDAFTRVLLMRDGGQISPADVAAWVNRRNEKSGCVLLRRCSIELFCSYFHASPSPASFL